MTTQPEYHRKVDEDSPDRCQAVNTYGQCNNVKVKGCDFCLIHGGSSQNNLNGREAFRNFQLTKFRDRVIAFAENPNRKSLAEEVGIVRLQIETIINQCKDETDLLMQSDKLCKLIDQADKLVNSCQKLEEKTGSLVDKKTLMIIAEAIVQIVSDHVTEADALDSISERIVKAIGQSVQVI